MIVDQLTVMHNYLFQYYYCELQHIAQWGKMEQMGHLDKIYIWPGVGISAATIVPLCPAAAGHHNTWPAGWRTGLEYCKRWRGHSSTTYVIVLNALATVFSA